MAARDRRPSRALSPQQAAALFLGVVAAAGTIGIGASALSIEPASYSGPLRMAVWAVALGGIGAVIGFIFSLPKMELARASAQGGGEAVVPGAVAVAGAHRPNTAIEEISDWLTKIIVGVGLVELREADDLATHLATWIAGPLSPDDPSFRLALGLVVLMPVVGFLSTFVFNRVFLSLDFRYADSELMRAEVAIQVKSSVATAVATEVETSVASAVSQQTMPGGVIGNLALEVAKKMGDGERAAPAGTATTDWETVWNSDPNRGFANGRREQNGRILSARISPALGADSVVCKVRLDVKATDPVTKPLVGPVRFLLHPSFDEPEIELAVGEDGAATLEILTWGWFTVGAEVSEPQGAKTRLELSLNSVEGGTRSFYND